MLTEERLKELLDYDPETGVFRWRNYHPIAKHVVAGGIAGCVDTSNGYRKIRLDGLRYSGHRLAWFYVTGRWPAHQIDHVNGDRGDNRFSNLREATAAENNKNVRKRKDNASGFKGVSWKSREKKWRAAICVNGKTIELGAYDRPDLAYDAYCAAAISYHGQFARFE